MNEMVYFMHPVADEEEPEKLNNIDRSWIHDISKTKRELKWSPKYSYEEALRDIKKEMEKEGYIKKIMEKSN